MFHSVLSQDRSCMYLIPSAHWDGKVYTVYDDDDQYRLQLSKIVHAICSKYKGAISIDIGEDSFLLEYDEWQDFFHHYGILAIYMDLGLEPINII
ncbi:hypothetical protein ACMXYR_05480 [Neptuniibacter sp. QD29_5]|uniref:hypothetical protein n=1 Tax=Neptuniibacter sp. QD29_5 TaxID=3398207 RepID=UPI0039F46389